MWYEQWLASVQRSLDDAGNAGDGGNSGDGGTKPGDGGNSGDGGGKSDAAKPPVEPTIEELKTQLAEKTGKLTEIETKFGKQSTAVGAYNSLQAALKADKNKAIEALAAQHGLKIKFETDQVSDDDGVKAGLTPEALAYMDKREKALLAKVNPALKATEQMSLRQEFEDWDALEEDRSGLMLTHSAGQIPTEKVVHMAVSYQKLKAAIPEIEKAAVEKYKEELAKKSNGSLDAAGSGRDKGKQTTGKDFSEVVGSLSRRY